eukprot:TRINITY_DN158_c0_g1_i1.p1 TRINITY_DN158_c0_g1~~TRINITY_DN158_c0_g1_i1.p1  ORF type:complete len:1374 (-),score=188.80 TRINITY_DN158_c0_g1_i1:1054-5175(-)
MLEMRSVGTHEKGLFKLAGSVKNEATSQNKGGRRRVYRAEKRKREKKRKKGISTGQRNKEEKKVPDERKKGDRYVINVAGSPKCVTMRVGKEKYRALLDTGAEVTLMSEKAWQTFHPQLRMKKTPVELSSVSGESLNVKGKVSLEFSIGGKRIMHDFIVVKGMNRNFILGSDFMKENKVRIYFDLRKVRVWDVYVPYEEDIHIASLVRSRCNVVLKPQTAMQIEVKMKEGPYFSEERELEIVSTEKGFLEKEPGIMLANTVVRNNKKGRFSVLMLNTTNRTVRIHRGCIVGRVESYERADVFTASSLGDRQTENELGGKDAERRKAGVNEVKGQQGGVKSSDVEIDAPQEHYPQVRALVQNYNHLFASSDLELGQTDTVECKIDTGEGKPIRNRPYRVPLQDREIVDKALDEMLEAKVISRSQSPWSFGLVVVSKKDGSKRLCVDYRKLNEITKKNSYPLPLIDDILSLLGRSKYFTTLDLKSGYWQVRMSEADKEKTAFACHKGLFQFNVMPFGLSNAPSVFMTLMSIVLGGLENFAVAYIDDVLIFSETIEEHWEHVQAVFERFEEHNLKLKLKKCQFLRETVHYLGFVIGKDGISPEEEKVRAIRDMPAPSTVREVRSLMGMLSYYRRFVPNFSKIAEPIVTLTKKYARFHWDENCQKAFEYLKESLSVVPLLAYPDTRKPYVLYTDASDTCIGACLTQQQEYKGLESGTEMIEVPIYFLSHKLSDSQKKWSVVEKEAFAIHYALQKLDHYLHNAQFVIRTDHQPLKYLLSSPMQNKKVQMWAMGMTGYNCQVEYIPGSSNVLADLLSRMPDGPTGESRQEEVEPSEVSRNTFEIGVLDSTGKDTKRYVNYQEPEGVKENLESVELWGLDMEREQNKDPKLVEIKGQMGRDNAPKVVQKRYLMIEGVLYFLSRADDEPRTRLVIPEHLIKPVIEQYHDGNGHMGIDKTYDTLQQKYFWADMYRGLYEYVGKCTVCQARVMRQKQAPVQEMDAPPYPFAKVSLDLSGPYPQSLTGNKYIVAFVDHYTGWPEAYAVPDKRADTIMQLLTEKIIPRHSCPLQLVTDNGTENVNQTMRETLEELNIDHVTTSPYHPQANGKVERFHRTLHDALAKLARGNLEMWDVYLEQVLSAVRVSVSETTGHSPFFLLYARDPVLPIDNILRPRRKYMGEDFHKTVLENQHKTFTQVHRQTQKSREKSRRLINQNRAEVSLKVGDAVYLRNHQRSSKLDSKWKPYFRITKQNSPTTFMIRNQLDGTERKAHANHLAKAPVGEWEVPLPLEARRPVRRRQLVIAPDSDESDSGDSEEEVEIREVDPRDRDGSDTEDDIPLAELRERLTGRGQRQERDGSDTEDDIRERLTGRARTRWVRYRG